MVDGLKLSCCLVGRLKFNHLYHIRFCLRLTRLAGCGVKGNPPPWSKVASKYVCPPFSGESSVHARVGGRKEATQRLPKDTIGNNGYDTITAWGNSGNEGSTNDRFIHASALKHQPRDHPRQDYELCNFQHCCSVCLQFPPSFALFLVPSLLFLMFFKKIFYWSIVDLQYCVSFRCTAQRFSYIYKYIYIFFFRIFSIIRYYIISSLVPCGIQ